MTQDERWIERMVSVLGDPAGATNLPWLDIREIRRRAARRRARRTVTAALVTAAVVGGVLVSLPDHSRRLDNHRSAPAAVHVIGHVGSAIELAANVTPLASVDTAAVSSVAKAEQDFAFSLLRQLGKEKGTDNVVASPASLAIALSMLETGALGTTRDEIAKTLHTSHLSSAEQNAGWSGLVDALAASNEGFVLQSANSLWLQSGFPFEKQFMDAMARYYRTGVWTVDYASDVKGASDAINAWVKQQTHGTIDKLFPDGALSTNTALVIANALYLKASWQFPFSKAGTHDAQFHRADGSTVTVPLMTSDLHDSPLKGRVSSDYSAVELPYAGGRFAAVAVMPKRESLAEFAGNLDASRLAKIVGSMKAPVEADVPKFTLSTEIDLLPTLTSLGMQTAFTDNANFRALSSRPLLVGGVAQRDFLRVDEAGTEAAAATGVEMEPTAAYNGPTVVLDHPFLFLVRDTVTGTIVFAAQVQDPTA